MPAANPQELRGHQPLPPPQRMLKAPDSPRSQYPRHVSAGQSHIRWWAILGLNQSRGLEHLSADLRICPVTCTNTSSSTLSTLLVVEPRPIWIPHDSPRRHLQCSDPGPPGEPRDPPPAHFRRGLQLPSGRYRVRYRDPDRPRVSAPNTFASKGEADRWLTLRRAELLKADWTATVTGTRRFGDYAETWLTQRQLKPRTRAHYRSLLDKQILPTFASTPLRSISPTMVRGWYASLSPDTPTLRAHAYGLLRAILHTAVYDGEISANPAHIRGAGTTTRAVTITPATLDELTTLVARDAAAAAGDDPARRLVWPAVRGDHRTTPERPRP